MLKSCKILSGCAEDRKMWKMLSDCSSMVTCEAEAKNFNDLFELQGNRRAVFRGHGSPPAKWRAQWIIETDLLLARVYLAIMEKANVSKKKAVEKLTAAHEAVMTSAETIKGISEKIESIELSFEDNHERVMLLARAKTLYEELEAKFPPPTRSEIDYAILSGAPLRSEAEKMARSEYNKVARQYAAAISDAKANAPRIKRQMARLTKAETAHAELVAEAAEAEKSMLQAFAMFSQPDQPD